MTVTKEQLNDLFDNIKEPTSDWYRNAMRLYEKSRINDLTTSEKLDWQKIQTRNYIDFADTLEARIKINFLNAYLKADSELQEQFYQKTVAFFTPGQFAVIAVRLNSLQVLDLAMDCFIEDLSRSHDYNLITALKLIYKSAMILDQNPDTYLQHNLSKVSDGWALSFVQGYLNQSQTEKLRSGYKAVYDPNFGYIKE